MSLRFLLDTDTLSIPARSKPDETLLKRLQAERDASATASVVWHELLFGLERLPPGKKCEAVRRYIDEVVSTLPILPYDDLAAAWHATERARLTAAGKAPPFADGQVAAIARVNGLTVVTRNIRHYASFADVNVVDWCA